MYCTVEPGKTLLWSPQHRVPKKSENLSGLNKKKIIKYLEFFHVALPHFGVRQKQEEEEAPPPPLLRQHAHCQPPILALGPHGCH